MHKFIFSKIDTFIDNSPIYTLKNFGRDEILEISVIDVSTRVFSRTSSITPINTEYFGLQLLTFNGSVTGSITGSGISDGYVIGCGLVLPDPDC